MLVSLGIGLAAFAIGAVVVWAVLAGRIAKERERAAGLTAEAAEKQEALEAMRGRNAALEIAQARLETENRRITALEEQLTAIQARCSEAERAKTALESQFEAQKNAWLAAERALSEKFDALAAAALRNNNESFLNLAKETLGAKQQESTSLLQAKETAIANLLAPIQEKFLEFQQKVEGLKEEGIAGRAELKTHIEGLRSLNERLSGDAENLVSALKGSSKVQGDWGEFVLEKLLQMAGFRRNIEYRVQETLEREDGNAARVDFILDLPDNRHIVIDSKVSLNDYRSYCSSEDGPTKKDALKRHLSCIRAHVKELSERRYQELSSLNSLDFVFMFVPIEPAYLLAITTDDRLWEDAWNQHIVLTSPSGFFSTVRTVAQIWRNDHQNRNVERIANRGKMLYEKFTLFAEDLLQIGRKLGDAREAYDKAFNKLHQGKGNLISQAQKLVELGIKPNKTLPIALIEQAVEASQGLALAAGGDDSVSDDEQ